MSVDGAQRTGLGIACADHNITGNAADHSHQQASHCQKSFQPSVQPSIEDGTKSGARMTSAGGDASVAQGPTRLPLDVHQKPMPGSDARHRLHC
jgi:hypothetical protein